MKTHCGYSLDDCYEFPQHMFAEVIINSTHNMFFWRNTANDPLNYHEIPTMFLKSSHLADTSAVEQIRWVFGDN